MAFTVTEPVGLLDFLRLKLTDRSRNNVKSLLTRKAVFVDGRAVTQYDHPLNPGQIVRVAQPTTVQAEKPKDQLKILYEDHELIVINKPAGLLTIATDTEKKQTAYYRLNDYVRSSDPDARIFIVHRLDRDTSGVLLFAKNEQIKLALQEQWDRLVCLRGYRAVVEGRLNEKSGRIQSWLKQTKTLLMYSSAQANDGLEAITNYQVLDENALYSLLDIQLETGRKNQIRVHMKELGHPVVGDKKYGARSNPLKRLGLHAHQLELTHPFTNERMRFEAPPPSSFKALMKH